MPQIRYDNTTNSQNKIYYLLPLQIGQVATLTLVNHSGDFDLWLLHNDQRVAQSEQGGGAMERIVYTVEEPGAYQAQVRPYTAPAGSSYTLTIDISAAPVQPQQFKALAFGLASIWQAKLQNAQGVGGSAVAIGVAMRMNAQDVPDTLSAYNLIIIGHSSVWRETDAAAANSLLSSKPVLLQGNGGRQFAELTGLLHRGAVWSGEAMGAALGGLDPVFNNPYPVNLMKNPMPLYDQYQTVYGVPLLRSYLQIDGRVIVGRLSPRIGWYGLAECGLAESWMLFVNLAWSLAVLK